MPLIQLVIVLIVIAVLLGLVNYLAPYLHMDPKIVGILNAVVVVAVVIWILALFLGGAGIGNIGAIRVGH